MNDIKKILTKQIRDIIKAVKNEHKKENENTNNQNILHL